MKGIPADKVDPHASWAVNPPEDDESEYRCECWCMESDHDEDGCQKCGECEAYKANFDNPVDPPERDPDEAYDSRNGG